MNDSFEKKILKNIGRIPTEQIREVLLNEYSQRNFFEKIIEAIPTAFIVIDTKTNIEYANPSGLRLLGRTQKKIKGINIFSIDFDSALKAIIQNAVCESEKIINHELTIQTPSVSIVSISCFPFLHSGHISGYILTIQNITDAVNDKLRKYHKDSIESLAYLTAGVAHEIKNPLGALDLHIQLVRRFIEKKDIPDLPELNDLLTVIEEEIRRLERIVNDFLFSVRPIKPNLRRENIHEVIKDAAEFAEVELQQKNITLDLNLCAEPAELRIDRDYFRQAMINIIQNAAYAIDGYREDGKIEIATEIQNEKIAVIISDNGRGISKENMGKVFEPFFSTKEIGTGLGLTIVYKIIHEQHGDIIIDSEENKGTVFRIEFPSLSRQVKLLENSGQKTTEKEEKRN